MADPIKPDPYIDEVLQNPGEPVPGRAHPSDVEPPAKPSADEQEDEHKENAHDDLPPSPDWPAGVVKPEDQSGG